MAVGPDGLCPPAAKPLPALLGACWDVSSPRPGSLAKSWASPWQVVAFLSFSSSCFLVGRLPDDQLTLVKELSLQNQKASKVHVFVSVCMHARSFAEVACSCSWK